MRLTAFIVILAAACSTACTTVQLDEEVLFQGKMTVVPGDFPQDGYALTPLAIEADGATLDGWHLDRPGNDFTVLYFGGQGFHLVHSRPFIQAMSERNVDLVMFDYRGYGKSTGDPTVPALKADALLIWDYVTGDLGVAPDRIVLHGHSMGSFVASYTATERTATGPAGLVLENPASDVEEWRKATIPFLLRVFINFEVPPDLAAESNTERVANLKLPVLILAGSEDKVTPPELAQSVHEASASPDKTLVVLEGEGHNDMARNSRYRDVYDAFLSRLAE